MTLTNGCKPMFEPKICMKILWLLKLGLICLRLNVLLYSGGKPVFHSQADFLGLPPYRGRNCL